MEMNRERHTQTRLPAGHPRRKKARMDQERLAASYLRQGFFKERV